jgi:glutamyl-tRNA reductase
MYSNQSDEATDGIDRKRNAQIRVLSKTGSVVAEARESFVAETRCRADPVIARFRAVLMNIQADELNRLYNRLPELDEHSRQAIGQFAECLVATMLRPPQECLQKESGNGPSQELVAALQRLFQLEN